MSKQRLIVGDCLERLKQFKPNTFTAVVCDPLGEYNSGM